MFGVIWIWVSSKTTSEEDGGRICINVTISFVVCSSSSVRVLCADVTSKRIQSRVYIFDIVLAHNLLVNNGGILLLLGEERRKEI